MDEFVYRTRVRISECDPQGIVFNPNFLMYVAVAMAELWSTQIDLRVPLVEQFGVDVVTGSTTIDFKAPARPHDDLDVRLSVDNIGTTSVTYQFKIDRDETRIAEGSVRYICVDPDLSGKTAVPDNFRAALLS